MNLKYIRLVTIQPVITSRLMLISVGSWSLRTKRGVMKKRYQYPIIEENKFIKIYSLNFNKDGY